MLSLGMNRSKNQKLVLLLMQCSQRTPLVDWKGLNLGLWIPLRCCFLFWLWLEAFFPLDIYFYEIRGQ